MEDFEKPKIIYPETTSGAYFVYDTKGFYIDKTCFMLISDYAFYLQKTLSSKLFEYAYKNIFSSIELGLNGYQYNKHALIKLPIFKPSDKTILDDLNEQDIDLKIFEIYKLSKEEINYINAQ